MRPIACVLATLTVAMCASAQIYTRSFGSVVFPAGTSSVPGITRNFGSVVFPGGANVPPVRSGVATVGPPVRPFVGQGINQGFNQGFNNRGFGKNRNNVPNTLVYAFPTFIGGGYDSSLYASDPTPAPPVAPPPMMYPMPQTASPVMIPVTPEPPMRPPTQAYRAPEQEPTDTVDTERYLLAFKDHTVYSTVAYWFDGDTVHYFTAGNVHNQASISLLDVPLTARLNKELGIDFHIPSSAK